jgi:hypothetical protein
MNPRVTELLDRLDELNADELLELRELIVDDFTRIDSEDESRENTRVLVALANAADKLTTHLGRRNVAALAEADVAVTAAAGPDGGRVTRLARRRRPQPSPERAGADALERAVLTASAAMRGIDTTKPITDPEVLAEGLCATLASMSKSGPPRGDVVVASATWNYPEERQLGDSLEINERRLAAVCAPDVLVATGGICAPLAADFTVPTFATADRPIRDGLPPFSASRGGIRFVKPPDISDLAGATSIWTEATDAEPGGETKAVLRIECGSEEHVFVEAIPTRLLFGNMMSRFQPEWMSANVTLATAAAARTAENNLLNLLAEKCVKGITSAALLGATRDLLTACGQASAQYRQLHRLGDGQVLTAIMPRWARDLIRVDLAREIGHAQTDTLNALAITDDQVDELMMARGIKPIWHMDGQGEAVEGGVSQVFAAPVKGAIKPFPTAMVWYLFAEGSVQFLDGGRLDLGVVRDSTLDATNDFELFVEPFESIAFRGFSGGALQLVSTLCANGASAGTISTAGKCA